MEGLGEGGTTRWTTVLGESGKARTEINRSQVVETMKGGSPKGRGPRESGVLFGVPHGAKAQSQSVGDRAGDGKVRIPRRRNLVESRQMPARS